VRTIPPVEKAILPFLPGTVPIAFIGQTTRPITTAATITRHIRKRSRLLTSLKLVRIRYENVSALRVTPSARTRRSTEETKQHLLRQVVLLRL